MDIVDFDVKSIGYGDRPVLKDIKFKLRAGEFLGIMGPSGVGKSTILRIMVGFHHDIIKANSKLFIDLVDKFHVFATDF